MSNSFSQPDPPVKPKDNELVMLMQAMFENAIASLNDIAEKYTEVCARLNIAPIQTAIVIPEKQEVKKASRYHKIKRFVSATLKNKRRLKRYRSGVLSGTKKRQSVLFHRPYGISPFFLPGIGH